jgi:hypothetical protein
MFRHGYKVENINYEGRKFSGFTCSADVIEKRLTFGV